MKNTCFFLFLLLIIVSNITLFAQKKDYLVVKFTSGETMSFAIKDKPKVVLDGFVLRISTNQYLLSNVSSYTFDDSEMLNINNKKESDTKIEYSREDKVVTIFSTKPIETICLYKIDGTELPAKINGANKERIQIDLSSWKEPFLLLQVGKETFKIKTQ